MSLSENGSKISTCACGLTEALPCRRPWGAPLAQVDAFVAGRGSMDRGGARARSCARRGRAAPLFRVQGGCAGSVHTGKRCGISVVCTGAERAAPVLKVRQMKTRWGVCVPAKRQITFSLRLAEKPRAAVEYVVLHEYAHFGPGRPQPRFLGCGSAVHAGL